MVKMEYALSNNNSNNINIYTFFNNCAILFCKGKNIHFPLPCKFPSSVAHRLNDSIENCARFKTINSRGKYRIFLYIEYIVHISVHLDYSNF